MTPKKLLLVAGARPNFMKIAPILRAMKTCREQLLPRLVHTGQHYDRDMSDVFFEELEIPTPDFHLEAGSGSHAEQTATIMVRFEAICRSECPHMVLVVGDVNSTLACSIVAKKLGIAVAHVEAGLRSGDRSMPEEINRLVTDAITDYFFVTEQSGIDHLLQEGKPHTQIHFVGHVMIDNLFYQLEKLRTADKTRYLSDPIRRAHSRYAVLTLHRPANVDNAPALQRLLDALAVVSQALPVVFPMHPRTEASLQQHGLALPPGIIATRPLPYMDFLNLFSGARLVLTDSGGLQEETTALGIPCLTLRENTERPVTLTEGSNRLVGTDTARIIEAAQQVLQSDEPVARRPALWDGHAAERIVDCLLKLDIRP